MSKFLRVLALLAAVLCVAAVSVGCQNGGGVPAGYEVEVTYYLSGGTIETYEGQQEILICYRSGSKIAEPGKSTAQIKDVVLAGFSIDGWYVAETDEEGNVIKENDVPKASQHKFDFSTETVTENITLVAVWDRQISVVFQNYYYAKNRLLSSACSVSGSLKEPTVKCYVDAAATKRATVEGYFWSYDEGTQTYSDPITAWPVNYQMLNEHAQSGTDGKMTVTIYTKVSEQAE